MSVSCINLCPPTSPPPPSFVIHQMVKTMVSFLVHLFILNTLKPNIIRIFRFKKNWRVMSFDLLFGG